MQCANVLDHPLPGMDRKVVYSGPDSTSSDTR